MFVGLLYGITPACAGKTAIFLATILTTQDHPRVCGKNRMPSLAKILEVGSPPRVREKQTTEALNKLSCRITPACAGKTLK